MRKVKLGDIYTLKLPNNEYAFFHVHHGEALGVYKHRGKSLEDIPIKEDFEFFVYVYKYVFKSFIYIQNKPFQNEVSISRRRTAYWPR